MIVITCALQHDFLINTIEKIETYNYKFEKKQGIKLTFSVDTDDLDAAIAEIKKAVKATEVGSVLYFQVAKG